jgi:hypothetical protein
LRAAFIVGGLSSEANSESRVSALQEKRQYQVLKMFACTKISFGSNWLVTANWEIKKFITTLK